MTAPADRVSIELGARADSSTRTQALKARERLYQQRRLRGQVLFHVCPDGYTSLMAPADTCVGCGWSPLVPVARLEETAEALIHMYGAAEAEIWAAALLSMVTESNGALYAPRSADMALSGMETPDDDQA